MNAGLDGGPTREQVQAHTRAERVQLERERLGIPVQVPVLIFDDGDQDLDLEEETRTTMQTCWIDLGCVGKQRGFTMWGFVVEPGAW